MIFDVQHSAYSVQRTAYRLHAKRSTLHAPTGQVIRWLLVGLAIVAVLGLVFVWIVRALPNIALAQIGQLTNTRITVESVKLGLDGSVLIKKLVIRPDHQQQYDDSILKAETVYARFSIGSLLLLGPQLNEIRVNDFLFDAQYDLDTGAWNVAALKLRVPRDGSGKMPAVHLNQGTLQYSKVSNGQAKVAASVPIHAEFGFDQWTQEGYRFNIRTDTLSSGFGKSNLSGFFKPGRITLTGGISSTDIPALEWAWAIDILAAELNYDPDRNYSLKLRIKDFHSAHAPAADAFGVIEAQIANRQSPIANHVGALQRFFSRYRPAGTVDIDLDASGNFDRASESTVGGRVYCKDVSVCDRKFPYVIDHLIGEVDFTRDGVVLNALSGKHGDIDMTIDALVKDFGPAQQYHLRVTSNNMILDDDLYNALGTGQKKIWDAFSPGGLVAVDYRLSRNPQTDKRMTLGIELLDAEATYKHFPYPLKNLTGNLFFDGDSILVSDVASQVDECKIALTGNVTGYNTEQPICYLSITAGNVPLDSTLTAALPPGQRSFYSRFAMVGLADAQAKIFTLQQTSEGTPLRGNQRISFLADVTLKETSLKVGESPLTIHGISAKAVITPDSINIKEFAGRCSEGDVSVAGGIWLPLADQPPRYHLTVGAKQAQLNADLVGLIPAPAKKFFCELTPQGRINLTADLRKTAGQESPSYQIVVQCGGVSVDFEQFAYPLKNIVGRLAMTNRSITFDDITASPASDAQTAANAPIIKLNGQIALADDALGQATLALSASDIVFEEQLGAALINKGIAPFYDKLRPSGRFDLDLPKIEIFTANDGSKCIDFAGAIRLKNCRFDLSARRKADLSGTQAELNALLNAKGLYKIGSGFSAGAVSLTADSLRVKGKAITNLNADINYDGPEQTWLAENLLADCYGGRVAGKLEFKRPPGEPLNYLLQVGFDKVDLKQFLSDTASGQAQADHTTGIMTGALSIMGSVAPSGQTCPERSRRVGQCRFAIRDMQVGKLSPLAKLLYVLKLTEPRDFAFEQMVVDSYIKADRLLFEKFDLSGQAIAFSGSGWMDLQSDQVNLVLTARGKRLAAAEPSLMQSLAEGLGRAVVRLEVTGNVHDPQVTTITLPVIEDSLKILGTKRKPTE